MYFSPLLDPKSTKLIDGGDSGDVGGQKTLRTYWRNYFERTDTLIWVLCYNAIHNRAHRSLANRPVQVVDATDRSRVGDCREELHKLLLEEVCVPLVWV
jgi:ADP-ribosylation factor-like protein 2